MGKHGQHFVSITWGIYWYILVYTSMYHHILTCFQQHAHIENIKTVAILTNNKNVFMCIPLYHALAGYLQTYETLLKEINSHPGSAPVPTDQYNVECAALADHNFNVPCKTGIHYPSLLTMINCRDMLWRPTVTFCNVNVYTLTYLVYTLTYLCVHIYTWYILWLSIDDQASDRDSAGFVLLDINLLKPSRIEFVQGPAPPLTLGEGQAPYPNWLEFTGRHTQRCAGCRQSWQSGSGRIFRKS